MGLFAKGENSPPDAAHRMAWTRERGTRNLVLGFVLFLVLWYGYERVREHMLLQAVWRPLSADTAGLTVAATLDGRSYDQNMFRIIQANQSARVELTDRGWKDIFDGRGGEAFSSASGAAIRGAISDNGDIGYAMLEPYLRYAVQREMHHLNPGSEPGAQTPVAYVTNSHGQTIRKTVPLGELLAQYRGSTPDPGPSSEADSGGDAGGGHSVDHGLAIPPDVIARVCPVVLVTSDFTRAELDRQPANLLQGETFSVHLFLTDEGRSRFYQWSHDHEDQNLVFVLNHLVVAAGRIKQTMNVNDWAIGPIRDRTDAQTLVQFVNSHGTR